MASIKKPVLVIKKSHLFKPLIIHKTIKRPVTQDGSETELSDAKRPRHVLDIQMKPNMEFTSEYAISNVDDDTNKSKRNTRTYRRLKPKIDKISYFCESHGEMPEHQAKGLVNVGDIFSSAEEFTNYANAQAKKWLFYYVTTSSRNSKLYKNYDELKPTYVDYKCRYFKGEHKSTSKGLRKVRVETVACPANIRMRRRGGETHFEVIRACHHHNHVLSWELFNQLPHGYRLPQEVKDEIRDLTLFGLDPMLLRKYLQCKLGIDVYKTVYNFVAKVKKDAQQPHYPPEKVKAILSNIKFIKSNYGIPNKEIMKKVIETNMNCNRNTKIAYDKEDTFLDTEVISIGSQHKTEDDHEMKTIPWEETMVNEVEIDNYSANHEYSSYGISTAQDINYGEPFIDANISTAETCAEVDTVDDTEICVADDMLTVGGTNHEYADTKIFNLEHISSGEDSTHTNYETETCATYDMSTAEDNNFEKRTFTDSIAHTTQEILSDSACVNDYIEKFPDTINIDAISGSNKDTQQQAKKIVMREFIKIIPINQIGKVSQSGVTHCNIQNMTTLSNNVTIVQPVDSDPIIMNIDDQDKKKKSIKTLTDVPNGDVIRTNVSETNKLMAIDNVNNLANLDTNANDQIIGSSRFLNPETGEFISNSIIDYTLGEVRHDTSNSTFEHHEVNIEPEHPEVPVNNTIKEETKDVKIEQMNFPIVNKEDLSFIQNPNQPFIKDRTDPPEVRCQRRHKELPEYKTEGLVQIGDVFESIEFFYSYANERAKHWFFYYMVCDSRNSRKSLRHNDKRASYVFFSCRFNKGKRIGVDNKGLRKRKPKTIICPAGVQLKSDTGTTSFHVTYVCHHHSHELSHDMFKQESHGYRLPQELKNEIHQLLWLKLDKEYVQRYIRSVTGYNLRKTIYNIHQRMQRTKMKIYMAPDKIKDVLAKIKEIKKSFPPVKKRTSSKKVNPNITKPEQYKTSRVETRLNNILYDQELIHSVQELERNMGCEIHIDNWEGDNGQVKEETSNLSQGLEFTDFLQSNQEDNESQIEVDSELYAMDENVQYIMPSVNESNVMEKDQGDEDDGYLEDNTEQISSDSHNEATYECSDYGNGYEMIYQYAQDEESLENTGEQKEHSRRHIDNYSNDTIDCRDIGVQADFEIIELERESELLNRLESKALSHDVIKSRSSFSTRGNPKIVLEEGIINRYNIEFYIGLCGITTCLENLANNMKLSVLDLLKKLYQGEAVFKMSVGRSGKNDRKSVQLKYVPLTIAFPYEKFKYINGLQEYKIMCSKYSDMTLKLETVVDDLSTNLKAMETRFRDLELHNKELIKLNENTEELKRALKLSYESLTNKQAELVKTQALNKVLLSKNAELVKNLASLKTCFVSLEKSQVELHKAHAVRETILKTNTELKIDQVQSKLEKRNELLQIKIRELENILSPRSSVLYEKIKFLEEERDKLNEENESQKKKITHLEDLYLADSQILLNKIKVLEEELKLTEKEINTLKFPKTCNASETCLLSLEIENKLLHKKIKDLEVFKAVNQQTSVTEKTRELS